MNPSKLHKSVGAGHQSLKQLLHVNVAAFTVRSARSSRARRHPACRHPVPISAAAAAASYTMQYSGSSSEDENLAAPVIFGDLVGLLRPDAPLVGWCLTATAISVGAFVCVAPALGRVVDVISASTSTQGQLAVAVATLGGVYMVGSDPRLSFCLSRHVFCL
jgi:hypothetical protein